MDTYAFPKLKIIPINQVRLAAISNPKSVDKLTKSFSEIKILKNPIIVTKVQDEYMVVDGTSRFDTLKQLNAKHILAQVIDYDDKDIVIESWDLVVKGIEFDDLLNKIKSLDDVEIEESPLELYNFLLQKHDLMGNFIYNNKLYLIKCSQTYEIIFTVLKELIEILSKYELIRVAHRNLKDYLIKYPDSLVYCSPIPSKVDIVEMFTRKLAVYGDTTRHLIPKRVLRLDFDIDVLLNDKSTEEKNKILLEHINKRIKNGDARFYQEPVFVFE